MRGRKIAAARSQRASRRTETRRADRPGRRGTKTGAPLDRHGTGTVYGFPFSALQNATTLSGTLPVLLASGMGLNVSYTASPALRSIARLPSLLGTTRPSVT